MIAFDAIEAKCGAADIIQLLRNGRALPFRFRPIIDRSAGPFMNESIRMPSIIIDLLGK